MYNLFNVVPLSRSSTPNAYLIPTDPLAQSAAPPEKLSEKTN